MISLQSTELLRVLPKITSNELTRDLSDVASRFNPESNPKPKMLRVNLPAFPPLLPKTRKSGASNINKYPIRILHTRGWNEEKMAFENMATWGMTWGYIFVIVIAGLALLVGKKKGYILKKKKLAEESKSKEQAKPETSPELEQVKEPEPKKETEQADGKESEKTE